MIVNCGFCQQPVKKKNYLVNHTISGYLFCNRKCKNAFYGYDTTEFKLLKQKMRELRQSGMSYKNIKNELKLTISLNSIKRHCKGIKIKHQDIKTGVCNTCQSTFQKIGFRRKCYSCQPQRKFYTNGDKTKYCKKCNQYISIDGFYKNKQNNMPLTHCIKCTARHTHEISKQVKQLCVDYKGGKCQMCQQSFQENRVYDFHHTDITKKDFAISSYTKSYTPKLTQKLKSELDKCQLLCANCHRIIHSNIESLKHQ